MFKLALLAIGLAASSAHPQGYGAPPPIQMGYGAPPMQSYGPPQPPMSYGGPSVPMSYGPPPQHFFGGGNHPAVVLIEVGGGKKDGGKSKGYKGGKGGGKGKGKAMWDGMWKGMKGMFDKGKDKAKGKGKGKDYDYDYYDYDIGYHHHHAKAPIHFPQPNYVPQISYAPPKAHPIPYVPPKAHPPHPTPVVLIQGGGKGKGGKGKKGGGYFDSMVKSFKGGVSKSYDKAKKGIKDLEKGFDKLIGKGKGKGGKGKEAAPIVIYGAPIHVPDHAPMPGYGLPPSLPYGGPVMHGGMYGHGASIGHVSHASDMGHGPPKPSDVIISGSKAKATGYAPPPPAEQVYTPPKATATYGPPPPSLPEPTYGPPPPAPKGSYGPPPTPILSQSYGPPPPAPKGSYGPPPTPLTLTYGPPPQENYGAPIPSSVISYGPPPVNPEPSYGPPPPPPTSEPVYGVPDIASVPAEQSSITYGEPTITNVETESISDGATITFSTVPEDSSEEVLIVEPEVVHEQSIIVDLARGGEETVIETVVPVQEVVVSEREPKMRPPEVNLLIVREEPAAIPAPAPVPPPAVLAPEPIPPPPPVQQEVFRPADVSILPPGTNGDTSGSLILAEVEVEDESDEIEGLEQSSGQVQPVVISSSDFAQITSGLDDDISIRLLGEAPAGITMEQLQSLLSDTSGGIELRNSVAQQNVEVSPVSLSVEVEPTVTLQQTNDAIQVEPVNTRGGVQVQHMKPMMVEQQLSVSQPQFIQSTQGAPSAPTVVSVSQPQVLSVGQPTILGSSLGDISVSVEDSGAKAFSLSRQNIQQTPVFQNIDTQSLEVLDISQPQVLSVSRPQTIDISSLPSQRSSSVTSDLQQQQQQLDVSLEILTDNRLGNGETQFSDNANVQRGTLLGSTIGEAMDPADLTFKMLMEGNTGKSNLQVIDSDQASHESLEIVSFSQLNDNQGSNILSVSQPEIVEIGNPVVTSVNQAPPSQNLNLFTSSNTGNSNAFSSGNSLFIDNTAASQFTNSESSNAIKIKNMNKFSASDAILEAEVSNNINEDIDAFSIENDQLLSISNPDFIGQSQSGSNSNFPSIAMEKKIRMMDLKTPSLSSIETSSQTGGQFSDTISLGSVESDISDIFNRGSKSVDSAGKSFNGEGGNAFAVNDKELMLNLEEMLKQSFGGNIPAENIRQPAEILVKPADMGSLPLGNDPFDSRSKFPPHNGQKKPTNSKSVKKLQSESENTKSKGKIDLRKSKPKTKRRISLTSRRRLNAHETSQNNNRLRLNLGLDKENKNDDSLTVRVSPATAHHKRRQNIKTTVRENDSLVQYSSPGQKVYFSIGGTRDTDSPHGRRRGNFKKNMKNTASSSKNEGNIQSSDLPNNQLTETSTISVQTELTSNSGNFSSNDVTDMNKFKMMKQLNTNIEKSLPTDELNSQLISDTSNDDKSNDEFVTVRPHTDRGRLKRVRVHGKGKIRNLGRPNTNINIQTTTETTTTVRPNRLRPLVRRPTRRRRIRPTGRRGRSRLRATTTQTPPSSTAQTETTTLESSTVLDDSNTINNKSTKPLTVKGTSVASSTSSRTSSSLRRRSARNSAASHFGARVHH